jgi:hypothetical protein
MPKVSKFPDGSYVSKRSDLYQTLERLEEGVAQVFKSENYKEYLRVMGKFHNYSLNNTILIATQRPDATLVAGYNTWQSKFGRYVKKGERGIQIVSPIPIREVHTEEIKDENGNPELTPTGIPEVKTKQVTKVGYKVAYVIDISQTEGRELPNMGANILNGSVDRYNDVMQSITKSANCPIVFEEISEDTNGYFRHGEDKKIAIKEGMSEAQTVKTALHELAHSRMHDFERDTTNIPNRMSREVQAESVAFVVADHFGIDTSEYSFGYIAGWSSGKETKELKASLNDIKQAAHEIISDIEHNLETIEQDRLAQTKEAAIYIPGKGYIEVQECDDGWDYNFYNVEFEQVDGGVIEEPENVIDALGEACNLSDLNEEMASAQLLDFEDFKDNLDQVFSSPYVTAKMRQTGRQQTFVKHSQAFNVHAFRAKAHEHTPSKQKEKTIQKNRNKTI